MKDSRLPSKLLGFAATLGTTAGTFGLFAIQGIILARTLGPEQRGQFAAAVFYPNALLYLGLLGAQELFAGYAARGMPNAPLRRSAAAYALTGSTLTVLGCLFLSWLTIPSQMRFVLPYAFLCALTLPFQQVRISVQAVDHGQRMFTRYNGVRLLGAASFPIALLIGILFKQTDLRSVCALFFIAHASSLLLIQFGMDGSWLGPRAVSTIESLRNARGLIVAWIASTLLDALDFVLLMNLFPDGATLGFYAAAIPIAGSMAIVPHAAGLYLFNRGAREGGQLSRREVWQYTGAGLFVQILCGGMLALVLPWIVPVLYGVDFESTVKYAWALLPVGALRGMVQTCDTYLRARQQPGVGVRARIIALPVLVGVSVIGLPWLDAMAIPIGLAAATGLCFCLMLAAILRDSDPGSSVPGSPSALPAR